MNNMFFNKPTKPNAAAPGGKGRAGFSSLFRNGFISSSAHVLLSQAVEFFRNLRHALKPKTVFLLAVAIFVVVLFGKNLKDILLVACLALAASYSTIYKRTIRVPSAVELVTFGTVITGAAYGPVWGALFGVFTTVASEIISSGVDVNTLFYALSRGISGAVAWLLVVHFGLSVLVTGMIALVIFHVISDAVYLISGGIEAGPKIAYFVVVNTLFNFLMFTFFGKLILSFARL